MMPLEEQLIELAEGFDFEVKAAQGAEGKGDLPKDFWRTYSAFANTNGGVVRAVNYLSPSPTITNPHREGRCEAAGLPNF